MPETWPHSTCDFHLESPGSYTDQHGCRLTERADPQGHPWVRLYSRWHYHVYRYQGTIEAFLADDNAVMHGF